MTMFLIGFVVCYLVFGLFDFIKEEYNIDIFNRVFTAPWYVLAIIICFIPSTLNKLFIHIFKPMTEKELSHFKKFIAKDYKEVYLFGGIYLFKDYTARYFFNKIFFFRIKRD